MILFERRASAILLRLLCSRTDRRPFLLPANVCSVVPETFRVSGVPYQFVDISEPALEMDHATTLRMVRSHRYGGVLLVRPYGSERDPSPFFEALRGEQQDLMIIDDKCLCPPDVDGERLARCADVTLFSTGYAKHTDVGEGGFAHLQEEIEIREAVREVPSWLDLRPPDESWIDYRQRVIAASAESRRHKELLNSIYTEKIPREIHFPEIFQEWRFNIRVQDPSRVLSALFREGLFASRHYPAAPGFPVAERLHARVINLFNDRHFTEEQATRAAAVVALHARL